MDEKKLVLPPDASGTKTHPWFRQSHGGAYWICERESMISDDIIRNTIAADGRLVDAFSAHGISAMWSCAYHVPGHKIHSLDWFCAATDVEDCASWKIVGFEDRDK